MVVQVMGINVQPLLAVGGVSGIAIGFGAQSVSANAITGINLVSIVQAWTGNVYRHPHWEAYCAHQCWQILPLSQRHYITACLQSLLFWSQLCTWVTQ